MSIPLMNAVWKSDMPSTRKLVALSLADQANESNECYPSVPMIAQRCSLSDRAVRGAIRELEANGILFSDQRRGRSTLYLFSDPGTWCRGLSVESLSTPRHHVPPGTSFPRQEIPGTPAGDSAPPRHHVPSTPAPRSAITTIEPPIESPVNHQESESAFDRFWKTYPSASRGAKPQCLAKWKTKDCDKQVDAIVANVESRKLNDQKWLDGYIPNSLTFLNQERWKDPIPIAKPKRPSVSDSFAGKTYQGTPENELPSFLRADAA